MANRLRYWSRDFIDAYVAVLESDPSFQKAARRFVGKFVLRCYDTPDGKDAKAVYCVDRGSVSVETVFADAPAQSIREEPFDGRSFLARTAASYEIWRKLDRGEMSVVQALASPDYKIDGALRALANIKMLNAMSDVAARMDKDY